VAALPSSPPQAKVRTLKDKMQPKLVVSRMAQA
jgi:hypothetical protein